MIDAARTTPPSPYPSFMMLLPTEEHTANFIRHMTNHVSQRVAISQWPQYALASRIDQSDLHEPALMLVACEKDEGVRNRCTRTWLVFASELRWLLGFTEADIDDPTKFKVANEAWRIRIKNLRRWAVIEANPERNKHQSQRIIIPVNASSVVTDYFQDSQSLGWGMRRPSFGGNVNRICMLKSQAYSSSHMCHNESSCVCRSCSCRCSGSSRSCGGGSNSNSNRGSERDSDGVASGGGDGGGGEASGPTFHSMNTCVEDSDTDAATSSGIGAMTTTVAAAVATTSSLDASPEAVNTSALGARAGAGAGACRVQMQPRQSTHTPRRSRRLSGTGVGSSGY